MKKAIKYPIYVILENIRSLYNVGAIFRTSDGAGVKKIFLCGITGRPPSKEISKTALGAEKMIDFEYEEEARDVIRKLRKVEGVNKASKGKKVEIIGVELCKNARNYWETSFNFPVALVFGHETEGISDEVLRMCDKVIFVPMHGKKESLNVEAAFSTVVYETVRKYLHNKGKDGCQCRKKKG